MSRVASRVARVARRGDVPAAALAIASFCAMASVQPSILTQTGLDLTLLGIVPLALASVAQMIIMVGGDIDLSLGSALGLVNAIAATQLSQHVWVGVAELVAFLVGYVVMGAVVEFRALPSLIVTFAFAFIWGGFALVVLPTPGGTSPNWMSQIFTYTVPGVPEPILILVALGFASWGFMFATRTGKLIRTLGSRRLSVEQFAPRPFMVRLTMYFSVGVAVIIAGFALTAVSGAGDPNSGQSYLLMSIAAVVIGGGTFTGGASWPVGAVLGALALGFVSSLDSFFNLSEDLVFAIQGALLIGALSVRRIALLRSRGAQGNAAASGGRTGGTRVREEPEILRSTAVPGK